MKHYQIKTYQRNWTIIETINPNNVLNEINFSSNINWWLWQLTIQTDYAVNTSLYNWWELVKVRIFDNNHLEWKQIYFWYISQIKRIQDSSRSYFNLICLWLSSLLNKIIYTNWDYTKTPSAMIIDTLTYFRNYYTAITQWTIDTSITATQNFSRDYDTCFNVIKTTAETVWFKRFVDWEWKLQYFSSGSNHILHLWYDVEKIEVVDSIEPVVNYLYLERSDSTVQTYTDATSISSYWRSEKYKSNQELNSSATQDTYWSNYIAENKEATRNITITVNSNYSFEDIKPWDTISIVNTDLTITNLPINKIQYSPDKCVLTIEKVDTLRNVIE